MLHATVLMLFDQVWARAPPRSPRRGPGRAAEKEVRLPTASAHLAPARGPPQSAWCGWAGVCLLEMKGFCASPACGP
ncbi:hypothetical protein D7Y27_31670 [Corallococcus sp. AB004]|nr:hypothetical protein D7Y27_31670 [Corallococcus sp. AB004]